MSEIGEEIQKRLEAAIPEAFRAEGGFVTKWVLVAETIGADGERGVWTWTSDGMQPWDSMGLLGFALAIENRGDGWRRDGDADEGGD